MANLRKIGAEGEEAAAQFLKGQGYSILERNFSTRFGEIDVIARDKNTLVFVEVKFRRNPEFGSPQEAVTRAKILQIGRAALDYLVKKRLGNVSCRFDVVAVQPSQGDENFVFELFRDAFVPPLRLP
jgi:putative endonuclease